MLGGSLWLTTGAGGVEVVMRVCRRWVGWSMVSGDFGGQMVGSGVLTCPCPKLHFFQGAIILDVGFKKFLRTCLVLGWDKDSIKLKKAVFGFIEDVITKTIDYHLFDVVVEFHREIHDLNFRGSSCKNLFVLSSSNRGRLLGFTDLMRQKNKRMKQEGLIQHYGILEDLKSNSKKKIEFSVFGFIEDVITKTIDYHLFDVVVEFHREIHDLNFRGSSCKNLFVLSSSNRGRLLGFTDLMRQKNKRMKQEGLIQHYGILEDLKSNSSYLLI
ncbi:hypothetical protein Tco_0668819 [Tanacetum coccineum]